MATGKATIGVAVLKVVIRVQYGVVLIEVTITNLVEITKQK